MRKAVASLVCIAILFSAQAANALFIPFAQFATEFPATASYLSAGILFGKNLPVRFKYLKAPGVKGKPATGFRVQDAHLTFTAFRLSNAQSLLGNGRQNMRLYNFAFTLDKPIDGKMNLLSGSASIGDLRGLLGSSTAAFQGSTDSGSSVAYTSDFLTFAGTDADFTWALTGITPSLDIPSGNFRPFNAGLVGNFGYGSAPIASVPESGSLWLLCAGGVPLIWGLRRKIKRVR